VSRSCARPGCGNVAVATLSYAYADGLVVLDDLAPEAHPMVHDLCAQHSAGLRVPLGWELRDERTARVDATVDGTVGATVGATVDLRIGDAAGTHRDLIGA
jgi:hypothetical protein